MDPLSSVVPGLPIAEWSESQAQLFEDTWLLTLFTVLLAVAFPWFVSSFDINFAAASLALLALGTIYVGFVLVGDLQAHNPVARRRWLGLLHALGVIGLGFVWQRSGGLENPAFLLAFALPVIGASALSRWQPYATAVLALVIAAAVALVQAPELRWYVGGVHNGYGWLTGLFDSASQGSQSVLPGFYAPVSYDLVLLEVFAILVLACAVAAESLGNAYEKLLEHLRQARTEAARGQDLWTRLVQQLPLPALLVEAETQQILLSSGLPAPFWPDDEILVGRGLFDTLHLAYPERLQELIAGEGGVASAVVVQVASGVRVARVAVRHVAFDGRRLALVLLEDTTDAFCTAAALDAQEQSIVVIDALGRIMAANKSARALFPEISTGSEASLVLARAASSGAGHVTRWWEPGLTGRRRVHVTLLRRTYLATCTAVALPGEDQAMYVLAFAPLLPAEATLPNIVTSLSAS